MQIQAHNAPVAGQTSENSGTAGRKPASGDFRQVLAEAQDGKAVNGATVTVQRGDTLSDIANRYKVSLNNIRDANGLRGDRIKVGQVIQIPSRQRT